MKPTARTVALEQLLRIEEQGAFAGLVSGSTGLQTASKSSNAMNSVDLDGDSEGGNAAAALPADIDPR